MESKKPAKKHLGFSVRLMNVQGFMEMLEMHLRDDPEAFGSTGTDKKMVIRVIKAYLKSE